MSRATPSSSTPAPVPHAKSRRRPRLDRSQLLAGLELLSDTALPLPASLPSPPPSRSSSPVPGSKRKQEPDLDDPHMKKPRTVRVSATPRPTPSSSAPRAGPSTSHSRYDTSEDGELVEDLPQSSSTQSQSFNPVRRPRRSKDDIDFSGLHRKYQALGRDFKFSGDARVNSTYPSRHPNYRPLRKPPPTSTRYHKHANILARLELIEGLMCFAYAFWCSDFMRGKPSVADWRTMTSFMTFCKMHWPMSAGDDREKAISGLVYMLQAYIAGLFIRTETDPVKRLQSEELDRLTQMYKVEEEEQARKELKALQSRQTPPMLPSPASISTGSANSTPASRSTPNQQEIKQEPSEPTKPPPPQPRGVPPHVTVPVNWQTVDRYYSFTSVVKDSMEAMSKAQRGLTLPILAKYFPRTFARMIHTSYCAEDEYQPDFEDDDGELYWPSQYVAGYGIGWVCHLGRSMVRELGREYGYIGQDGLLSKDDEGGALVSSSSKPPCVSPHTILAALPSDKR